MQPNQITTWHPHRTPLLTEAVGLAVLESLAGGLRVVGREVDGTGQYLVFSSRSMCPCLIVGVARTGQYWPLDLAGME